MSLCGCDGFPEVHDTVRPRARKQYRCDECREQISPGDTYRRDFMVHEGEPSSSIVCECCDKLMERFFAGIPREYRHEITFELGGLKRAVIELRDEFGVTLEGFPYPKQEEARR